MRSRKPLFLAIALVVIVAGCTGTTGSRVAFDQNAGVKINQFSPDVTELFDNEPITLLLEVQNVGGKTMGGNSQLWIYGPVINAAGSTATWSVNSLPTGMSRTNGYLSKTLTTANFTPPNTERGIPGSVDVTEATLNSPEIPENMRRESDFYARVCYPYSTTSLTRLVATTRNQLRVEKAPQTDAVTRSAAGPIQVSVKSSENLIAEKVASGQTPIVIEVIDVGGGFATVNNPICTARAPDVSSKEINKVQLTVTIDGSPTDCNLKNITINKGVGVVSCRLPTLGTATGQAPKTEYVVTATADYNYYLTNSAHVVVKDQNL